MLSERYFVFATRNDGRLAYEKLGGAGTSHTCFVFKAREQKWDKFPNYRRLILANGLEIQCFLRGIMYIPNEKNFFGLEYGEYQICAASEASDVSQMDPILLWQCEAVNVDDWYLSQILQHYEVARRIRFENHGWNRLEGLVVFRIKCVLGLIDPLDYDNVKLIGRPDARRIELNEGNWFPVWRMLAYAQADENEWRRYQFPVNIDSRVNACFVHAVQRRRVTKELIRRTRDHASMFIPAVVGPARMYLKDDREFAEVIRGWCDEQTDYIGWVGMNNWDFSVLCKFRQRCPDDQFNEMLMYFEDWMLDQREFQNWDKPVVRDLVKVTMQRILCSFPCDWRFAREHDVYVTVSNWDQSRRDACIDYCLRSLDDDIKKFGKLVSDIQNDV